MLSVIADIDLLIPQLLHRGPSHSLITISLFFIPLYVKKGKAGFPYFVALIQHSIVGDFLTGLGIVCFWPFSSNFYGLGIDMMGALNLLAEGSSFLAAITLMVLTKDIGYILNPKKTSLFLILPLGALFPVILGKLSAPSGLLIPHYIFFVLFTLGLIVWFFDILSGVFSRN